MGVRPHRSEMPSFILPPNYQVCAVPPESIEWSYSSLLWPTIYTAKPRPWWVHGLTWIVGRRLYPLPDYILIDRLEGELGFRPKRPGEIPPPAPRIRLKPEYIYR